MAPPTYKTQVSTSGSTASAFNASIILPAGLVTTDVLVAVLTVTTPGRSLTAFPAGFTFVLDGGNQNGDLTSHCIMEGFVAQGSPALSSTALTIGVSTGPSVCTWALEVVVLSNAAFNSNPPMNTFSGGTAQIATGGTLSVPSTSYTGTDNLMLTFATINASAAGSTAASVNMTATAGQTQIIDKPVSTFAASSGYNIGFASGYGAPGSAKSYTLSRICKGGYGVNMLFYTPPKAATGKGYIVGTGLAKANRGKKNLTAARKATLTPGVGVVAGRGVAAITTIAKSGKGALVTTSTVTARAGAKNVNRTGSLLGIGLATARAGLKSTSRSGTLLGVALLNARSGIHAAQGTAALTTTAFARLWLGQKGKTGTGQVTTTALASARTGDKTITTGRAALTTTVTLQASGTGGHTGQAHMNASGTVAAQAGTTYLIPLEFAGWGHVAVIGSFTDTTGHGEHSGQGEIVASGLAIAGPGVAYIIPRVGEGRLTVVSTVTGSGFSTRFGEQVGAFIGGTVLLFGQHIPELPHEVRHLAMVIASGQGYLPPGTALAPRDDGKYVAADPSEPNVIVLRRGLNVGAADLEISGGIRPDPDGPPTIYACTAFATT